MAQDGLDTRDADGGNVRQGDPGQHTRRQPLDLLRRTEPVEAVFPCATGEHEVDQLRRLRRGVELEILGPDHDLVIGHATRQDKLPTQLRAALWHTAVQPVVMKGAIGVLLHDEAQVLRQVGRSQEIAILQSVDNVGYKAQRPVKKCDDAMARSDQEDMRVIAPDREWVVEPQR